MAIAERLAQVGVEIEQVENDLQKNEGHFWLIRLPNLFMFRFFFFGRVILKVFFSTIQFLDLNFSPLEI